MKLNKLLLTLTMLSTLTVLGANACPVDKAGDCPPPPPKFEKKFPPHKGPHHFAQKKKCNLFQELNLTEEQKATLKQNREESKKKMKPIMKKMSKKKYEIDKVMLSNASKLEKIEKIEKIKAEMKVLKIQADQIRREDMKKFESVLTDEQKAKFEEIKKEKKKEFEARKKCHQKGFPKGPQPIQK
jgi:Spy/CpxP family protein refolding chaperone